MNLEIQDIQKYLPQRYPFLMIDKVLELDSGKKVVALKNVSMNEGYFSGHFPQKAVMPGVLIIEAMAQAAIILFSCEEGNIVSEKKMVYYLGAVKVRFLNPVVPGDQLKVTVEPIKIVSSGALVNAVASVGDKEVARGELSFSVKNE